MRLIIISILILFSGKGLAGTVVLQKDTTIVYAIDGISTEGTAATTRYIDGKIKESLIEIYGEMGKAIINYTFRGDSIKVEEKQFRYKTYFTEVESDEDILPERELTYYLDLNGNIIGTPEDERIDIFSQFKEGVPFELK